ncbi:carboxymuconolactone decarboxylase family protein [Kibdelosporangium phytohabitans]|uniref:Carboxymuconolactone decarboxylase n=1 Tax=Kibdelosporangium phytohabitans TaxID=860235 RepID=A0A0N9I2J3_9PSEU|nr:carboxymuconolactone decarboxylase family protein [Kibdelosporangium phytohabitans]ALG11930.1 carboxymuconolactone decarboxylase [Kibdelosporangium phytohabitans]MBE1463384.1 alkylhydroperoxidase family enzyme [Kibdelosporangium phytohabitans]
MTEPRITPVQPPYDTETAATLGKWMPPGVGGEPLALFRTLVRHPDLASRMRPLGAGILGHGTVPARLRELVIHRTCARCGAEYEWGVHATVFAAAAGFTPEQLTATTTPDPDHPSWSDLDRTVLRAADELHDTAKLTDATFEALTKELTDAQILELVVTAGWYHVISFVVGAAGIPPEPWAATW